MFRVFRLTANAGEDDAALKEFAEKDWPRLENTFTPEFIARMRSWLK